MTVAINGTNPQDLLVRRGDTLALYAYRLGNISGIDDLWFTVKRRLDDDDDEAELQVSVDGGLLVIDGATATTPANGSITVVDAAVGNLTVDVAAVEIAKLHGNYVGYWDIQTIDGAVVETLVYGNIRIYGDVTRSTS